MTAMLDLGPIARQVAELLPGIDDDQLSARTPCEKYAVGDLLDHLMGLTTEFRRAAIKATMSAEPGAEPVSGPPRPSVATLHPDWRGRLPEQLTNLASAWKDPAAWEGTTKAGGVTLPADIVGLVALDELVLHGWDLARGTGQPFECDPASTEECFRFTSMSAVAEEEAARAGLFGPVFEVPSDAPLLHRALGLSGRDPAWTPPG